MAQIGIFYGTDTGNTEDAALLIQQLIGEDKADVFDTSKHQDPALLKDYDLVILGTSTWYLGEMQSDMDNFMSNMENIDLKGRKFALFGLGNQIDYSEYYLDGMGILYNYLKEKGAVIIGRWPVEGYDFASTLAITDDDSTFVGLALDNDNQSDLTPDRAATWVEQILKESGLE